MCDEMWGPHCYVRCWESMGASLGGSLWLEPEKKAWRGGKVSRSWTEVSLWEAWVPKPGGGFQAEKKGHPRGGRLKVKKTVGPGLAWKERDLERLIVVLRPLHLVLDVAVGHQPRPSVTEGTMVLTLPCSLHFSSCLGSPWSAVSPVSAGIGLSHPLILIPQHRAQYLAESSS